MEVHLCDPVSESELLKQSNNSSRLSSCLDSKFGPCVLQTLVSVSHPEALRVNNHRVCPLKELRAAAGGIKVPDEPQSKAPDCSGRAFERHAEQLISVM